MTNTFTLEIGARMLHLIQSKNWKVCYEWRKADESGEYQSMEEIFHQVADSLENGPRYYVFPQPVSFDEFMEGAIKESIQLPRVKIAGEFRYLFGFGIRDDECFFVTNSDVHLRSADREPKEYDFVLAALETLEEFVHVKTSDQDAQ